MRPISCPRHVTDTAWGTALVDSMIKDGLWDVYNDFHMGSAAELCATKFAISRTEQDEFAALSYRRAQAAQRNGNFAKEIVSVVTAVRNHQEHSVTEDEEVGKFDLKKMVLQGIEWQRVER
jgi:acetyl-CoA C-acetyltransferase